MTYNLNSVYTYFFPKKTYLKTSYDIFSSTVLIWYVQYYIWDSFFFLNGVKNKVCLDTNYKLLKKGKHMQVSSNKKKWEKNLLKPLNIYLKLTNIR